MEFPDVGANCALSGCNRLDFLPVKCAGCNRVFCKDHYPYSQHRCPTPGIQDKQVPVCPLCNAPVPIRPGELPDERVGQHIDTACKSKPALELKGKIFPNTCSQPKCKKREAVQCRCSSCGLNFCLAHRNELDHNCQGPQHGRPRRRMSAAGAAAIFRAVFGKKADPHRQTNRNNSFRAPTYDFGSSSTTDELTKAIQEEEDRQLALAVSASLNEPLGGPQMPNDNAKNHTCILS